MFGWLIRWSGTSRFAGHTAPEWYSLYRSGKLPQDPVSGVQAALRESLAGSHAASSYDLDSESCLSGLLATDRREDVRTLAAIMIGVHRTKSCEGALVAGLDDKAEIVRRSAALALLDIDTIRGLAAVVAGARHGHAVRTQAAQRLRERGVEAAEAIPALLTLLRYQDISWRSHMAAAEALAAIGEPAIPHLVDALRCEERRLRYYAAVALKAIGKPLEYLELIQNELTSPPEQQ